ncbi:hypothetical protein RJT34_28418 [Clitoria ternatea]|uniref:Uncharacterized protein n=1 Tax=Clitoria ternatea TaxID=43366 RepID=A0AAN9ICJ8_CLITE
MRIEEGACTIDTWAVVLKSEANLFIFLSLIFLFLSMSLSLSLSLHAVSLFSFSHSSLSIANPNPQPFAIFHDSYRSISLSLLFRIAR